MTAALTWRIGDVTVTRVPEVVVELALGEFLPEASPAAVAPHRDWLEPHFLRPDGKFELSIHGLVVDTADLRILVDTCLGPHPIPGFADLADGTALRGVLSLEILRKLETLLRTASGKADYRLADYFDYIAGTSTGGIIAAGLAIGMSIDEILQFYEQSGAQMFETASLRHRLCYHYQSEPLAKVLKCVFGEDTQLGSESVETLLLLVMRNATTDSPWPITNNPFAKYNDSNHSACNLKFPLWQLVRASTSAPTYFPQRLGRPKIDSATEWKVRKRLANGIGILKVAKSLGIGTGTVQRIANELR